MRRTSSELVLAGFGLVLLSGCGQAAAGAAPEAVQPSAPVVDSATAADNRSQWDPCADSAVATRVDEALASPSEGVHNSILVSPAEIKELGYGEAEAALQLVEWKKLSPADVAFQQCLRARQGEPTLDPVPGTDQ